MDFSKNFSEWAFEKKHIHESKPNKIFPKIRHIWYAKIGVNIGNEADGKKEFVRPVLVLAKIGSLYWVAPLTSRFKDNIFHHPLTSV